MRDYACNGEGAGGDHCCYVGGSVCPHLREHAEGRRYACALMIEHKGDWAKVAADPRYQPIGEHWSRNGTLPFNYCETFDPAFCCRPEFRCGRSGEHS